MARILVIEDNRINLKLAVVLVQRSGHLTLTATDAETGLLLARTERPDLILMDVQLPGMDGFTATAHLKNDPVTADIPVIALTAMVLSRDQQRARDVGCDAYITKPLHYQELHDSIEWLLPRVGQKRHEPEAMSKTRRVLTPEAPPGPTSALLPELRATAEAPTPAPRLPGTARLLVAEDNPTNQKLILWQLHLLGFDADVAEDGEQALERWKVGDYDLVITDLHMPKMNGYDLAAAIRAGERSGQTVPIVAITASSVRGDSDESRLVNMNEYLMRPLNIATLRAALARWLPEEFSR